jgi:hypothetical protein
MLLNLTNHPSSLWSEVQLQAAHSAFGPVEDLPFPPVDPTLDDAGLDQLVAEYAHQVRSLQPAAIHIMGELTFTFRLVNRLQDAGYRCVASTTERLVSHDSLGNKISTFIFVQFRDY